MTTDSRVTCAGCLDRLGGKPMFEASESFHVGNPAKPDMGHAMYFMSDGKTALCIAERKKG